MLAIGFVYFFQEQLIFQGTALPKDYAFSFDQPFEEVQLQAGNGDLIHGLYFPAEGNQVVLYLHGNADDLTRWGKYAKDFTRLGYQVLAIDYRGYGKSEGFPSESALQEDANIAYQYLRTQFEPSEIIIYGRSLGSSVATHLAGRVEAHKLVLETPFSSMTEVVASKMLLLPFELRHSFPTIEYLKDVSMPVAMISGSNDWVTPIRLAKKLIPLMDDPSQFYIIEGGRHKNLNTFPVYHTILEEVLK